MSKTAQLLRLTDVPAAGRKLELAMASADRRTIAHRLEMLTLGRLEAQLRISRGPRQGVYIVQGRLQAEGTQTCVVTLDAVATILDVPIERYFVLGDTCEVTTSKDEVVVGIEDEEPEPIADPLIDLGELVVEELALSLDPYPRSAEADEVMRHFRGTESDRSNPFAKLRRQNGGGT